MPKKKKGRRRTSLTNRLANLGILGLAFSPVIRFFTEQHSVQWIIDRYSMGLMSSKKAFDKDLAMEAYGPIVAALIVFEVKKILLRKLGRGLP